MVCDPCVKCRIGVKFLVAHGLFCQVAKAFGYSEVGRREMSRYFSCSNRVQRLTNANHVCPHTELLAVLVNVSHGKPNASQTTKNVPPSSIQ